MKRLLGIAFLCSSAAFGADGDVYMDVRSNVVCANFGAGECLAEKRLLLQVYAPDFRVEVKPDGQVSVFSAEKDGGECAADERCRSKGIEAALVQAAQTLSSHSSMLMEQARSQRKLLDDYFEAGRKRDAKSAALRKREPK